MYILPLKWLSRQSAKSKKTRFLFTAVEHCLSVIPQPRFSVAGLVDLVHWSAFLSRRLSIVQPETSSGCPWAEGHLFVWLILKRNPPLHYHLLFVGHTQCSSQTGCWFGEPSFKSRAELVGADEALSFLQPIGYFASADPITQEARTCRGNFAGMRE